MAEEKKKRKEENASNFYTNETKRTKPREREREKGTVRITENVKEKENKFQRRG